jgi:hypothetical protein
VDITLRRPTQQFGYGLTQHWMRQRGGDFRQRREDKRAFRHAGVRDGQGR